MASKTNQKSSSLFESVQPYQRTNRHLNQRESPLYNTLESNIQVVPCNRLFEDDKEADAEEIECTSKKNISFESVKRSYSQRTPANLKKRKPFKRTKKVNMRLNIDCDRYFKNKDSIEDSQIRGRKSAGVRVSVYWSSMKRWLSGTIIKFAPRINRYLVQYDNNVRRWESRESFKAENPQATPLDDFQEKIFQEQIFQEQIFQDGDIRPLSLFSESENDTDLEPETDTEDYRPQLKEPPQQEEDECVNILREEYNWIMNYHNRVPIILPLFDLDTENWFQNL
jgi:hypothetical protein